MALPMFAMQGVASVLTQYGSHVAASKKAEQDRLWQAYNNKMTRLQNSMNQNSLTTNENLARERREVQKMQIQRSEMATTASAEVSAAAAGTTGRSVDMVLNQIARNAATARGNLEQDAKNQEMQIDNQRMQSNFSTEMQIDYKRIPDPDPATMLLGITSDLGKLWKSNDMSSVTANWFK